MDVLQTIYYDAFFNIFFDQIRKQESGELKQIWKLHTECVWEAPKRTFIILTFQLQDGDFALKSAFTMKLSLFMEKLGPHFLCWILGVVAFNTWFISSWEENSCCYKLSKFTKWNIFPLEMVEVVILSNNSCHFVISSECNNKWILKVPPEIFESCIIHDFFRFLTWFFSVLLYEIKHVSKCEQKNKFIISLTFMVYSWFIAWAPDN